MPMGIGPGLSVTRFESGIPGWMTGMDLGWDFTQNVQYSGATNPTDTHSATIYAQSAAGVWSPFAANTLVRTDLGLQTVPTRTNLVVRSNDQSNAAWVITGGASVGAPVLSPSGGTDAYPITFAASSAAGLTQNLTGVAASTTYTASLWVRCLSGTELVRLKVWDNTSDKFSSNITVTTAWQRFTFTLTTGATVPTSPNIEIRNASDGLARTVLVYQAQLEAGAFASPPIVTTSSSATVNGNQQVVDLTGRLGSGVGGILQFNPLAFADNQRPVMISDQSENNQIRLDYFSGNLRIVVLAAGALQAATTVATAATGNQTIAFAVGTNFIKARLVGASDTSATTTATFPSAMTTFGVGGQGYAATQNTYQLTRRLALRFGAQNASTFADLFAKATILAAVS